MKSKEEILKEKFHGFSSEQWEELKNRFPYSEIPFAMDTYADELRKENERLRGLIEDMVKNTAFNIGQLWKCKTPEEIYSQMDKAWQQFKKENNL